MKIKDKINLDYKWDADKFIEEAKAKKEDKEKDKKNNEIRIATYVSASIDNRLILRSRSEDDFDPDTPLSIVDLGLKMHLWLSHINTWSDAEPSLLRMTQEGQITDTQAHTMRQQLELVRTLIQREEALYILFDQPQRGIAGGQFAAWYEGERLIGSGVIKY